MSSATTQRAGRAPKDKNKPQPAHTTAKSKDTSEGSKTSDGIVSKIQVRINPLFFSEVIKLNANYLFTV